MNITNRMIEAAEANVARERDSQIARIRADRAAEGEDICIDCDEPISAARKAALPSAERCIDCQTIFERTLRDAG